ncbi:Dynein gamma chain [Durusdinium trenchii]|uniref:Flagellar outer arm n=1 Tax=Durusdinium trenchii TaxID=1381693 RepID=A0ABP0QDR1_9DINO
MAIDADRQEANRELQEALPYLHEANAACQSIKDKDIVELKGNKAPVDIVKLTFDGLLLLMGHKVTEVKVEDKLINKVSGTFIKDSFDEHAKAVLNDMNFLRNLKRFAENDRDTINDETCELIEPYLRFDPDPNKSWGPWKHAVLDQSLAKKANAAAEGLCKFVGAMVMYHEASKIVKPKMDFLKVQEAKLEKARGELAEAEAELHKVQSEVAELDRQLQAAFHAKAELEASKEAQKRKMDAANRLLKGLETEQDRWTEDAANFATRRLALVGDVALAGGFVTYCGPFNSEFRDKITQENFMHDIQQLKLPANDRVNIVEFLVDEGTVGEWSLQGLPSDELSIQNAIMVTRSSRYPLMVDPQGQALAWIKNKEHERIALEPNMCVTTLQNRLLKDQLECTISHGFCLIIENVEKEVDPILDPVLEKAVVNKGSATSKKLVIRIGDGNVDYDERFCLYMTSRLPNPHFSPELSAKTTVIDFTVTLRGLEQQLLGRVLNMEQRALEEMLVQLKEDATNNTKSLQAFGKQLLERLSSSKGNLLDDGELIEVLANTKAKAKDVEGKLEEARQRTLEIDEKREQFRAVATRGSLMYFNMTDMVLVSNPITLQPSGWMYSCSLNQFLEQFDYSVKHSEKVQPTVKRVERIIDFLTYQVYRYMNRGLFERDKMMFKLMVALKISVVNGDLTSDDVMLFLKAGGSLDKNVEKDCPFSKWMNEKVWLNAIQLTRHGFGPGQNPLFRDLTDLLQRNDIGWRKWFDESEPENCPVPEYEDRICVLRNLGPFIRLALVRSLREDRVGIACAQFIDQQLGSKFTAPITDTIFEVYQESGARKPVLYLLSAGTDPTNMIDELAKRKKKFPTDKVSMGEGQEKVAREKNNAAFISGGWLVLQNCHLGIDYMNEVEETLMKTPEIHQDYRLWITCEITSRFPIGLLHLCIKVTQEPPAGLKASLHRTYTTMVTQETLDKVDHEKWRALLYAISFLHSIVQERRKFGPIGWCVPYEFNNSDLDASLLFLEKHLSSTIMVGTPLSWNTIQYMVAEVQYGGRITDDLDRELFITYAARWLCDEMFKASFAFNSYNSDYQYKIPEGLDMNVYRDHIETIPPVESPLIFGLHPNADITYRLKEASEMLTTIIETQPKDTNASVGKSMDEQVKDQCSDHLEKMPPDLVEEVFRAQIHRKDGLKGSNERGFKAPLNIFLFQELQRLQHIIGIVRMSLENLIMAIEGTVVMTVDLLEDSNCVFDGRVPKRWTHDASGAEISWLLPTLGGWCTGLTDRYTQLIWWLEHGRKDWKSFWMTGFTNAQGFLTGIRQEVTRQHKNQNWALDDVVTHTEVLPLEFADRAHPPEEGQNIHGLFIEGARWNRLDGRLEESEAKKLQMNMPVIYITAVEVKSKGNANAGQSYPPLNAAVYKYPRRNDRYLIFRLFLRSGDHHPHHWKLRGVCLVAQTD